jgi:NTP pyrophosphatase (non-canonical NTP hydrolase)
MNPSQRTYGTPSLPLSVDEYAREALAFEGPTEHSRLTHAVLGAAGEIGELASLIKRESIAVDHLAVLDECGDVLWYLTLALDSVGHTLEDAMTANIDKLARRAEQGKDKDAERKTLEEGAPSVADVITMKLVEHWERSPTCRSTLPPDLTHLIQQLRRDSGRNEVLL